MNTENDVTKILPFKILGSVRFLLKKVKLLFGIKVFTDRKV